MWLYLEIGLYRGDQVKVRSLGWALIQGNWYPHKKGNLDPDTHRRKTTGRAQGEDHHLAAKKRGLELILPSLPSELTQATL